MTGPMPNQVCATCQQPLNRRVRNGVETWLHPGMVDDHEPVPIPRSEATHVRNVCDFCGTDENVIWVHPTNGEIYSVLASRRFTDERETTRVGKDWERTANRSDRHEDLSVNRLSDRWTACDACSTLVEIPDMERLITHLRRFRPDTFAGKVSRTLLRQHFGEFFRLKLPRQPLDEAGEAEPGSGHDHALSGRRHPEDPDGLAANLALLDELVGAGVDRCLTCQDVLTTQVAADPVTTYRLVELACQAMQDRLGFVPGVLEDVTLPGDRPGVQSLGFRRVVKAAERGTARPVAAELAGTLSEGERRAMANEALDILMALLIT